MVGPGGTMGTNVPGGSWQEAEQGHLCDLET